MKGEKGFDALKMFKGKAVYLYHNPDMSELVPH